MVGSDSRERSRSPRRTTTKEPGISKGFKWKEKKPSDKPADTDRYRDTYRDRDEPKSAPRKITDDSAAARPSRPKEPSGTKEAGEDSNDTFNTRSKFGSRAATSRQPASQPPSTSDTASKPSETQKSKPSKPAAPTGPMIIVTVNDRLGTKAQIPCMASDPVKAFKMMVAARIGRQPHEIMLKRQGERPFKDQLTLEDYGVSNGVQLDLELDTGD